MVKILSRDGIKRMVGRAGDTAGTVAGCGSSGGGGGSAAYAQEAGHALEADHATDADTATNAGHATSADTATNAGHATTADSAATAATAQNLASNSSDWDKIARKDIAQSIAALWTFIGGLVASVRSYFNGGATVSKDPNDSGKALVVTGGIQTDTMGASGNATIGGTMGVTGNTTLGGTLGVTGNTTLGGTLNVTGKTTGGEAAFQTLGVSKDAHFVKLTVDEILSNKGAIIISSANCVAEAVVEYSQYYAVFFSMTDANGNAVTNPWKVGDQALCLTFKAEGAGTFADVRNRYYWRKVRAVNSNVEYDGNHYHLVCLSKVSGEYEGSTVPEIGDNIVQLGYTGSDAAYRQSATILSAYPTMDSGVTPPSLAFYKGINDFALASHRYTYIDGLNNEFMGNFKILVNGSYTNLTTVLVTLEGLISNVKKIVRGKNILPLGGWTDENGELLGSDNYDESTQLLANGTASTFGDVLYSPIIFLPAGRYTFSCYTTETALELYVYSDSINQQTPIDLTDQEDYAISNVKSGDTYQSAQRRYVSFTLDADSYVSLNLYMSGAFTVYRPMLEEGGACSAWETGDQEFSSQIKQTAENINLSIRDGLGEVGININGASKTIKLLADKVNFYDSTGTSLNPKVWLDPVTGAINAVDGNFEGTVKATNFYSNLCLVTGSGTTDVGAADTVVIGGSGINTATTDIIINLPAAATYKGKVITIYGGQRIASLVANNVEIRLNVSGHSPDSVYQIKTAWGTTGIDGSNNALRSLNNLVLRSNGANWYILEWHNASVNNTTYYIVDAMQGLT